jgi:hypothetical protein
VLVSWKDECGLVHTPSLASGATPAPEGVCDNSSNGEGGGERGPRQSAAVEESESSAWGRGYGGGAEVFARIPMRARLGCEVARIRHCTPKPTTSTV